jgi:hypothetical protein
MEEQDIVFHLLLTMPNNNHCPGEAQFTLSFVRTCLRDEDMKREGKQRKKAILKCSYLWLLTHRKERNRNGKMNVDVTIVENTVIIVQNVD